MASIVSVNNGDPLTPNTDFEIVLDDINSNDVAYVVLTIGDKHWSLPTTPINNTTVEATTPEDLPASTDVYLSLKENIALRNLRIVRDNAIVWLPTINSSDFSATAGTGSLIDTTSGVVTMELPPTPELGNVVAYLDYSGTFDTNIFSVDPGTNKLNGLVEPYTTNSKNECGTLIYTGSTNGWKIINLTPSI